MKGRRRSSAELDEAESYYISMTDMLVGVLFIFIILLSFFALQFRTQTQALTSAKDAQTATLLKIATALEKVPATLEVDRGKRVVCIPASVLVAGGAPGEGDRRCFAFSESVLTEAQRASAKAEAVRKSFVDQVTADIASAAPDVPATSDGSSLVFAADKLFQPGSAQLSDAGVQTAQRVAEVLAGRLPCYGYGAPTTADCSKSPKMAVVNVAGQAGFDAFTQSGRAAVALSLDRSVAFHDALVKAQPVLGQIRNSAAAQGSQPLLRVSTYGQSQTAAPAPGTGQTISIQFNMAE